MHLAAAWHREERERACDDVVLAAGTAPTTYADHLVDLVRAAVPIPSAPAVAFGTPSRLNQRIRAILDDGRYRTAPTVATLAAGVLTATAVVTVLSGARLMAQPSTPRPVGDHRGGVVTRDISAETRQRAAETLAVALRDSEEEIRSVATRTIDSIQANTDGLVRVEAPCGGNCVNWHQVGNAMEQVLHLFSDEAAIGQLANADAEQRRAAVWRIWPRSEGGAAALAGALLDDDRAVRNAAAIRLDSVHAPVAVPNWIVLLGDTDPMLRERAAISLGVIGDPRAIEPLGEALRDAEPAVRLQAAKALAAIAIGKAESTHGSMHTPVAQERQVYRPGDTGVTLPELVSQVQPEYTRAAMKAGIQGSVILEGVVEPDGSLGYLRVVQSLDEQYGLDMQALHAAGRWKFKPGLREGTPVPVLIALDVTFRLR